MRPLTTRTSRTGTRLLPSAVGISRWQMMPFSDPARLTRTWVCWCGGKKSTIRLMVSVALMVWRVEKHQVPGLGCGQRGGNRLRVPHLADQDDVGILPEDHSHGRRERVGVEADLPLIDGGQVVCVQVLDRILDRHDVARTGVVDVVDHGRQRGGLARAGRPGRPVRGRASPRPDGRPPREVPAQRRWRRLDGPDAWPWPPMTAGSRH